MYLASKKHEKRPICRFCESERIYAEDIEYACRLEFRAYAKRDAEESRSKASGSGIQKERKA